MHYGISLSLFPTKWELGVVRVRKKNVIAFGPFRVSFHRVTGSLKSYKDAT